MDKEVDVELAALGKAADAFSMVDIPTAERMLVYLRQRFVVDAKQAEPPKRSGDQ